MDSRLVLKTEGLKVEFNGQPVLQDISFELHREEILIVLGPNGAGKSVLLRALLGLIPYQGKVQWKEDITIGYVPEEFIVSQTIPLSVEEFFKFKQPSSPKIRQALKWVGLDSSPNFLGRKLGILSSGQFRRTLIAWAMVNEPDVLFLDEPMVGVDIHGRETIYDSLVKLWQKKEQTVLLVSHEIGEVCKKADSVLAIDKKRLFYGPPEKIINPKNLAKIYGSAVSL